MKHPETTTNTQFSINKSIYLLLNLFIFLAFFSCHNEPIKQDDLTDVSSSIEELSDTDLSLLEDLVNANYNPIENVPNDLQKFIFDKNEKVKLSRSLTQSITSVPTEKKRMSTLESATAEHKNIALGKGVIQGSYYSYKGMPGSNLVNGVTSSSKHSQLVHTQNNSKKNWVVIDLYDDFDVSKITVYNRTSCCGHRLNKAKIYVGDRFDTPYEFDPSKLLEVSTLTSGIIQNIDTKLKNVRFVYIKASDSNYLNLLEMEVYGGKPKHGFCETDTFTFGDTYPDFEFKAPSRHDVINYSEDLDVLKQEVKDKIFNSIKYSEAPHPARYTLVVRAYTYMDNSVWGTWAGNAIHVNGISSSTQETLYDDCANTIAWMIKYQSIYTHYPGPVYNGDVPVGQTRVAFSFFLHDRETNKRILPTILDKKDCYEGDNEIVSKEVGHAIKYFIIERKE